MGGQLFVSISCLFVTITLLDLTINTSNALTYHNVTEVIAFAVHQYHRVVSEVEVGNQYPSTGYLDQPRWQVSTLAHPDWTIGFFAGILWQLYSHTQNALWRALATKATDGLYAQQFVESHHDIGFIILCSYGDGYRLTKDKAYPGVIVNAANHLTTRFNPKVGCIRSWGSKTDNSHFLMIADNMMNLELLLQAYDFSHNKTYREMAISHANRTAQEHLRPDGSSFHVVDFNGTTGAVKRKYTRQGYSDSSCWSRGQAWLVTGFTRVYRYTKMEYFLHIAEKVAKYFIDHLPEDGIPPWDFSVPHDTKHAYIPRDVSAGAIAAVGLYELHQHTNQSVYLKTAQRIVQSLSSAKYLLKDRPQKHLPALLGNSTIMGPNADPKRSDLSLVYADYYFLQALEFGRAKN